jgi:hypothetical protein
MALYALYRQRSAVFYPQVVKRFHLIDALRSSMIVVLLAHAMDVLSLVLAFPG